MPARIEGGAKRYKQGQSKGVSLNSNQESVNATTNWQQYVHVKQMRAGDGASAAFQPAVLNSHKSSLCCSPVLLTKLPLPPNPPHPLPPPQKRKGAFKEECQGRLWQSSMMQSSGVWGKSESELPHSLSLPLMLSLTHMHAHTRTHTLGGYKGLQPVSQNQEPGYKYD